MPRKPKLPLPTEKQVEAMGDRLMASLGFSVWKLSQARATMQTPGWPDRLYMDPALGWAVWWEAKRETGGKYGQTEHQARFERECRSCHLDYVCGDLGALENWLIEQCYVERLPSGALRRTAA